jgi:hypothetical protein
VIDWTTLFSRAGIAGLFFVTGWAEAWLFERRDIPCLTWALGLLPLIAWIAYPFSLFRSVVSLVVLAGAALLMWRYYNHGADRTGT